MEKVPKLKPATTLLSISQRFAAIQKNSPLGSINLNSFQDTSNSHAGPYAQYKPDAYGSLMNQRPSATLVQGSAQNQLILQQLQAAMGKPDQPLTRKTITKAARPIEIIEPPVVSNTGIAGNVRTSDNRSTTSRSRSKSSRNSADESNSRRDRYGNFRKVGRSSSGPRESRDKPRSTSLSSSSVRRNTAGHNRKPEPPKKPISERLGRISVFNRLGSPTKKSIHERLSYSGDNTTRDRQPLDKSRSPRVPVVNVKSFKSRNSNNARRPVRLNRSPKNSSSSSSHRSPISRRVSLKDLDDDLDQYMSVD